MDSFSADQSLQTALEEASQRAAQEVRRIPIEQVTDLPPGVTAACISDTHGRHGKMWPIPDSDILIHAGDFSDTGHAKEVKDFAGWLDELPHSRKIFIAGNHDTTLDTKYYVEKGAKRFHPRPYHRESMSPAAFSTICRDIIQSTRTCTYLEDSSTIIENKSEDGDGCPILVYGSPWQPEFCDWAFNLDRGRPCQEKWEEIPVDTDILITHGPPTVMAIAL